MKGVQFLSKALLTACSIWLATCSSAYAADDQTMDQLLSDAPATTSTQPAVQPSAAPTDSASGAPTPSAPLQGQAGGAGTAPDAGQQSAAVVTSQQASDVEKPAAPKGGGGRMVEEIVVTAQKREESIQNVPIAIQAFSPAALEARGITNTTGLQHATPGLDVGSNAGFTTIFLRGVGTEAFLTADPSIANYIDGVYFPFSPSFSQEFGAVQRVEVLKGPQGTLFGRNAVGGAISIITKEPDYTQDSTVITSEIGSFAHRKISLFTNVPLADNLAMNFSGFYLAADSYLSGSTNGGHPLQLELSSGAKVKLKWSPIEDVDLVFGVTKSYGQDNSDFPINLHPSPLGVVLGVPAAVGYTGHVDENLYHNLEITVYQFEGRYRGRWFDTKLLASKQDDSVPFNYDFDGSIKPYVSFNIIGHSANIHEGELQLLSNQGTPFSDWLTTTAGVYYFDNIQGFHPIDVTVGNLDPAYLAAAGINVPQPFQGALNSFFGQGGILQSFLGPAFGNPYYVVQDQALARTRSLSEYLQTTAKITDWVAFTFGIRYADEWRGVYDSRTAVVLPSTGTTIPVFNWTTARDQEGNTVPNGHTTRRVQPKGVLDFHPFQDDTLLYFSYQQAVKAHAYNTYAIYEPPEFVKAEKTTAYEVGLKSRLFDDNMTIQGAVFKYAIKDLQTQFVSLINGGAVSFEDAGPASIQGADFDMTTVVFPSLVSGLEWSLNGCVLRRARYDGYDPASGFDKTTGLFSADNDYVGNRITRSPKFTSSTALTKTFAIPGGPLELAADYYFNSGFWYSASNDPRLEQNSYHTYGAHVSYLYEPWRLRVTGGGTNITNQYYTAGVIGTDFGTNYHVGPPRLLSLMANWSF